MAAPGASPQHSQLHLWLTALRVESYSMPECKGLPVSSAGRSMLQMELTFKRTAGQPVSPAGFACCRRQVFGGNATKEKVRDELMSYSDFGLHAFSLAHRRHFAKYLLSQDAVFDSAKCCRLRDMLLELKSKGSR